MSPFIFPCVVVISFSTFISFGAESPIHSNDSKQPPKGLSGSDWSGIRAAYENGRHAIATNPDGTHQARNPGQTWLTRFDGRGFTVTPDGNGWSWGLELKGYGYQGHEQVVSENAPAKASGSKLEYQHDGNLTEWFVNDSRGLEQGWTIQQRPDGFETGAPLRLEIGLRGDLEARVESGGTAVSFVDPAGSNVIQYASLKAWDADGKSVPVSFDAAGSGFRVVADDAAARYPITIDPIAQQAYLKASNTEANDGFGYSVAVSGGTVVVGARHERSGATGVNGNQSDNSAEGSGAAYVFVRSGNIWVQQAYLKASNTATSMEFGNAVAVAGDTIVVGSLRESGAATGVNGNQTVGLLGQTGAAYVFVRSGTIWSQQAYLKASNTGSGDHFGFSVAISGETVVVGASDESSNATGVNGNQANDSAERAGAAYVFSRSGTTWTQQAYLKASNTDRNDFFGYSVGVSGDTVVVGAEEEDSNATGINGAQGNNLTANSGAAYIFVRNGGLWSQQAYLKASNTGNQDGFGYSAAISGDTVVVGAWYESSNATGINGNQTNDSAEGAGAAYVFVRNGTAWTQQAYLKGARGSDQRFGNSVGISGNSIVVGSVRDGSGATGVGGNPLSGYLNYSGAAYVFVRAGTTWSQLSYLKASNPGTYDFFGQAVAISGDTVVVGADYESSNATGVNGNQANNLADQSGAAYVFNIPYRITASALNGTVAGAGDFALDTVATVTATPKPGYIFSTWTGDATGTTNPLSMLVDGNKTIAATFIRDTRDPDGDELDNYNEIMLHGTDPNVADTDGDGYSDGYEVGFSSNPKSNSSIPTFTLTLVNNGSATGGSFTKSGSLGHGTNATVTAAAAAGYVFGEWTNDASGKTNPFALLMDSNKMVGASFAPDTRDPDGDGLDNYREIIVLGTNPDRADTDGDGVADGIELTDKTNPKIADTDHDGLLDGVEKKLETNPLRKDSDGDGIADAEEDRDKDGIGNGREANTLGTNPNKADTDGNGLTDTFELAFVGKTGAFTPRIGDRIRLDFKRLNFSGTMRMAGVLPAGLHFDPVTQVIKGKLVGKPGSYSPSLQLFDGRSFVRSISLPFRVEAFPLGLADSYEGLLENRKGEPVGMVSVKVSAPGDAEDEAGTWSAILDVAGSEIVRKAAGSMTLDPAENSSLLKLSFPAAGKLNAIEATMRIETSNPLADGNYSIERSVASYGNVRGFRLAGGNLKHTQDRPFTLIIDQGERDGFSIPAGLGWATGVLSNSGEISITGQLGDSNSFETSTHLSATGQAILWVKPYHNSRSYLGGIVSFRDRGLAESSSKKHQESGLSWYRSRDPEEDSYRDGFGPILAQAGIAFYHPPSTAAQLGNSLGLEKRTFSNVLIEGGGLPDPKGGSVLPEAFTLGDDFGLLAVTAKGKSNVPWQGSIEKRDGSFTGKLALPASGFGIIKGTAKAGGVLIPGAGYEGIVGAGLVKVPTDDRQGAFRTAAIVISK